MDNGETTYLKNETVYGDTILFVVSRIDGKGNKLLVEKPARSIELAVYTETNSKEKITRTSNLRI